MLQIQKWYSPPLPNAGQLSLSQVSWSRPEINKQKTFTSTTVPLRTPPPYLTPQVDNYDEDPWDLLMLRLNRDLLSSVQKSEFLNSFNDDRLFGYVDNDVLSIKENECIEETSELMLAVKEINECLDCEILNRQIEENSLDDDTSQLSALDYDLEDLNDEEFELEFEEKGSIHSYPPSTTNDSCCWTRCSSRILSPCEVGTFGVRRTCYHYKPQVKRCTVYRNFSHYPLFPYSEKWHSHKCLSKIQSIRKNLSLKLSSIVYHRRSVHKILLQSNNLVSKAYCSRFKSLAKRIRAPYTGYSTLLHKHIQHVSQKNSTHKSYERIMWRVSPSQLERITTILMHYNDSDTLLNLTPVSYSLSCLGTHGDYQIVYSQIQDSYGASEGDREEWVIVICLCCLLMFVHRILESLHDCWLSLFSDFIS